MILSDWIFNRPILNYAMFMKKLCKLHKYRTQRVKIEYSGDQKVPENVLSSPCLRVSKLVPNSTTTFRTETVANKTTEKVREFEKKALPETVAILDRPGLQFMAKITRLGGHLVEKSRKYQWFTRLVPGTERFFGRNLHP